MEGTPDEKSLLVNACKVGISPTLHRSSSLDGDKLCASDDDDDELKPLDASTSGPTAPGQKSGNRVKRTRFQVQRSVSINDPPVTAFANRDEHFGKPKRLNGGSGYGHGHHMKSPSASNLLNKVKERIREKVFQSSEWPNAAAMIHERRQRANDALNASLCSRKDFEAIQLHGMKKKNHSRSKTTAFSETAPKYDIIVSENGDSDTGEIRSAFIRRRSISEDTYDRKPCVTMKEEVKTNQLGSNHSEAKWFGARLLKKSPRPIKKHMRAVSLDSARMNRVGLESQTSVESSSSTMSSVKTMDSLGSGSLASIRIDTDGNTATGSPPVDKLPELVLDDKAKETILEVTVEEEEDDGSEVDYDEKGRRKPKPVPEIVFDEHGQTWDVYGAEFDPEILGHAIQKHLDKLIGGNIGSDRRMSTQVPASYQQEVNNEEKESNNSKTSSETSFWLRLFCMFSGRGQVSN